MMKHRRNQARSGGLGSNSPETTRTARRTILAAPFISAFGAVVAPTAAAHAYGIAPASAAPEGFDATSYFDLRQLFAGVKIHTYGNSWIEFGSYGSASYPTYLPPKLGFSTIVNRGKSGSRMQDTAIAVVRSGVDARTWNAGKDKGVVLVGDLLNNLIEGDTPANRTTALEAMRTVVAVVSASSRVEQTAFTFGANWTSKASNQPYASGRSAAIAHSNLPATATIPVPAGTSYVLCHGTDGKTFRGPGVKITQSGKLVASKDLNGTTVKTPIFGTNGVSPVVVKLKNLSAGTVTLTTDLKGRTSPTMILDALLPQSSTPPLVVLVKPVSTPNAPTHNKKAALFAYLRTVPDTVAAEFGKHIIVVDPEPGWNPVTMLGADGLHPNLLGSTHITNAIVNTIKGHVQRRQIESLYGVALG